MKGLSYSGRTPVPLLVLIVAALPLLSASPANVAPHVALRPGTLHAFQKYVEIVEARNKASLQSGNFLWMDDLEKPQREGTYGKLKRGEVVMRRVQLSTSVEIPDGMVHDWEALVFIPGVTIEEVLRILQDYDHHSTYYSPDVERSKILQRDGDRFRVFLRFRRTKIVTVVMNTEHDVTYFLDSPTRAHSRSSAVRIVEVENPGSSNEKELLPGRDQGFLWRMETWWRLEARDGGVYVQNEVVSLTRDIPTGLGWIIEPFVNSIPKESLEFTMIATRKAVLGQHSR